MNPTRNLIPSLLNQHYDTYIFGPGYQTKEVLDKGIQDFVDKYGPFELTCSNEHIAIFYPEAADDFEHNYLPMFKNNFYSNFLLEQKHLEDMSNYFRKIESSRKVLFLLEFDYYWLSEERLLLIEELDAFIVGFGEQFITPKDEMTHIQKESFSDLVNDRWYNFVKGSNKIIQFTHFVNYSEFYWESIDVRKYECSVPGVGYWARKEAYKNLKNEHKKMSKNYHNKIYHLLSKMGIKSYSSQLLLSNYIEVFNQIIRDSKYAYTCGSALNWPIRKFFEIPAKGTLLISLPFKNFEHLGFINEDNCIIAEPENIISVVNNLNENLENAQDIADRGRKMVHENHSISARSQQLKMAFDAIIKATFDGSYWESGRFIVREKK